MIHETEDQTRLRRAKESISACQDRENECRRALAAAAESTKRARERFEEIYLAAEKHEVTRLRAQHNHCTK